MAYGGGATKMSNTVSSPPLHTIELHPNRIINRVFALIYMCALIGLFCHHIHSLLHCTTTLSTFLHLSLLLADAIFAFMWSTTIAFRIYPIIRKTYPENLLSVLDYKDYPGLDVFICTADPYKEPPINVVNTALSVLAYDYPADKVSVYVSDDGGSVVTLFAFMEAAKFASYWLPFCKEKKLMDRCPKAYFGSTQANTWGPESEKIKIMYETMKSKVESVLNRGGVSDEHITNELESKAFKKWTTGFTRQEHPTVIQILLDSNKNRDIQGNGMPNLVYVSREKNKSFPHQFKAGALNTLLRVSATMTNAPVVLTQDCDMFSNDPKGPIHALCYLFEAIKDSTDLAYVQFPQRYHGINKDDTYGSEMKWLFKLNPRGFDGLLGPNYVGTGCFFLRRAFFGSPSSPVSPEIPELNPNHVADNSIQSETVLDLAHTVASCRYENATNWGSQMGFRYGSLVEDYYTGFRLLCEGWKSVFCEPDRPAFLGDIPIALDDVLSQVRRWAVGVFDVAFSTYSPITFGMKSMGLLMGMGYSNYAFWPSWSIPITIYAFLPPLTLLNQVYVFPKLSSPLSYLYIFLFVGAYGQECREYISAGSTFKKWFSEQRMWMIRGASSHAFGSVDFLLKRLGITPFGFNVTSKVVDGEQNKRYQQGLLEFGVASPLFVPLTTIALVNLVAFVVGLSQVVKQGSWDERFLQLSLSGFVVVSSWPIYEAIVLRVDHGKMSQLVTSISMSLTVALYLASFFTFRN
ncbi:hypothetical protein ACHQM5_011788 [Ranunculus cassubicifolius]